MNKSDLEDYRKSSILNKGDLELIDSLNLSISRNWESFSLIMFDIYRFLFKGTVYKRTDKVLFIDIFTGKHGRAIKARVPFLTCLKDTIESKMLRGDSFYTVKGFISTVTRSRIQLRSATLVNIKQPMPFL